MPRRLPVRPLVTPAVQPVADAAAPPSPLRPSEYTGLLIHALETTARPLVRGAVLELGVGSGVVLAALARLGAARLTGTDIEPLAVQEAAALLARLGHQAELLQGDLWAPVAGRRFDLIVANPPHLATPSACYKGRLPSWSHGGPDGRRAVDPILRGLRHHLADGGRAVLLHSAFLGLPQTESILAQEGLAMRRLAATLIPLAPEKRAVMTPEVLERAGPGAIRHLGDHAFLATDILEIGAAGSVSAD